MAATRERILDKALELFNERGIEYTGMRELAAALGMRIGNITYYFPTKDDLVFRLSEQYTAVNSAIFGSHPGEGLYDYLKMQEALFRNRICYRSIMLSMVHLIERNPMIAENYEKVGRMRMEGLKQAISSLAEKKYLVLSPDQHWFLVSACSLIMRFWISEAALSGKGTSLEQYLDHYLKLLAHLFLPYAGKKGAADIGKFLGELEG